MRAHCINFYGDESEYLGDMWITNVQSNDTFHIDMNGILDEDDVLDLSPYQVRQLKEACDAFLAEQDAALASPSSHVPKENG